MGIIDGKDTALAYGGTISIEGKRGKRHRARITAVSAVCQRSILACENDTESECLRRLIWRVRRRIQLYLLHSVWFISLYETEKIQRYLVHSHTASTP